MFGCLIDPQNIFDWYDGLSNHQGGADGVDGLPFVTVGIRHQPRDVTVQVRVRERLRKDRPRSGSDGGMPSQTDSAARTLTLKIKQAKSAAELLHLLDGVVEDTIFNYFHASAAYSKLAEWKQIFTPSEKASPVLPRLAVGVQRMTQEGQVGPRAVATVLYSLGKLSDRLEIPKGLLTALVKSLGEKASGMDPQGLSNSLLACVQLKVLAPDVLTVLPKLAAQISIKAKDMNPQDLSNNLWAAAHLKDTAPEVKEIVPAIVAQIQDKANGMNPQGLSNSLWAATRLKDSAPEVLQMVPALVEEIPCNQESFDSQGICNCLEGLILLQDSVPEVGSFLAAPANSKDDFLGFAAKRFSTSLPTLKGNDLKLAVPSVVWACAKVNFYHEELLVSVAHSLKSEGTLQGLTDWSLCAILWSYDVLDPDDQFAEFKNALESERVRRGLSDTDVSNSQSGNRAKG